MMQMSKSSTNRSRHAEDIMMHFNLAQRIQTATANDNLASRLEIKSAPPHLRRRHGQVLHLQACRAYAQLVYVSAHQPQIAMPGLLHASHQTSLLATLCWQDRHGGRQVVNPLSQDGTPRPDIGSLLGTAFPTPVQLTSAVPAGEALWVDPPTPRAVGPLPPPPGPAVPAIAVLSSSFDPAELQLYGDLYHFLPSLSVVSALMYCPPSLHCLLTRRRGLRRAGPDSARAAGRRGVS